MKLVQGAKVQNTKVTNSSGRDMFHKGEDDDGDIMTWWAQFVAALT